MCVCVCVCVSEKNIVARTLLPRSKNIRCVCVSVSQSVQRKREIERERERKCFPVFVCCTVHLKLCLRVVTLLIVLQEDRQKIMELLYQKLQTIPTITVPS